MRHQADVLIGIHIRRGDYRVWRDGMYFFDDASYASWMQQLEEVFLTRGQKVIFYLASDEAINEAKFKTFKIYKGQPSKMVDLYTLAQCDYLLGPPSTFSLWAAFIGHGQLLHVEDSNQRLKLESFKYYESR